MASARVARRWRRERQRVGTSVRELWCAQDVLGRRTATRCLVLRNRPKAAGVLMLRLTVEPAVQPRRSMSGGTADANGRAGGVGPAKGAPRPAGAGGSSADRRLPPRGHARAAIDACVGVRSGGGAAG